MQKITSTDPLSHSEEIVADNVQQLRALFPEAFTEGKIDFEVLKQLLGSAVDEREEKYGLNWHGKRRARQLALTPSAGTLRPCPEDSVDWDTTRNLMIEGDNLEVLKLLQKSYSGKVKLIYIDPPYNTGNDFVYPDDFQDNIKNYRMLTGQTDSDGRRITSNSDASGRFHTHWLNMILPRLWLARSLLKPEGTIFINCGEAEIANLCRLCDEVFGEENRLTIISRVMKSGGAKGNFFTPNIDYIVVYARSKDATPFFRLGLSEEQIKTYYNKTQSTGERKGELYGEERLYKASLDARANQRYWIECPDRSFVIPPGVTFPASVEHGAKVTPTPEDGVWKWTFDRYKEEFNLDNIVFKETTTSALVDQHNKQSKWNIYNKVWLKDQQEKGVVPANFVDAFENRQSSAELKLLGIPFDFAKPVGLICHLLEIARTGETDIIVDFFAGSGTTGHGVLVQNHQDGGQRRFILVQLPEPLDPSIPTQKEAAVFCDSLKKPRNICELTKERLRRVAVQMPTPNPGRVSDLGFRVFKLDASNIQTWDPDRENLDQSLLDAIDHIKPDRSEEDVLYELLLKLGLDLCVPIGQKTIAGKTVHSVGAGVLLVCLSEEISRDDVEALAHGMIAWHKELAPSTETTIVFRDSGFTYKGESDDVAKTNITEILKQHGLSNVRSL